MHTNSHIHPHPHSELTDDVVLLLGPWNHAGVQHVRFFQNAVSTHTHTQTHTHTDKSNDPSIHTHTYTYTNRPLASVVSLRLRKLRHGLLPASLLRLQAQIHTHTHKHQKRATFPPSDISRCRKNNGRPLHRTDTRTRTHTQMRNGWTLSPCFLLDFTPSALLQAHTHTSPNKEGGHW